MTQVKHLGRCLVVLVAAATFLSCSNPFSLRSMWDGSGDDGNQTPADPRPDYSLVGVSHPDFGIPGTAIGSPAALSVAEINGDTATDPLTWSVYASYDTVLDGSDTVVASGAAVPPAGGGNLEIDYSGSGLWPSVEGYYFLLCEISSANDAQSLNNVTTAGPVGVYSNVQVESAPNDGASPPFSASDYEDFVTAFGPLDVGEPFHIVGKNDGPDGYDTYRFIAGTAGSIHVSADWGSPTDDIDLAIYDDAGVVLDFSSETANSREPATGTFDVPITPGSVFFVQVYFYYNGESGGERIGESYALSITGGNGS